MTAPLALTMGDPAGVGPEITTVAWNALKDGGPAFFVIGDPALYDSPVKVIQSPTQAADIFSSALPVLPVLLRKPAIPGAADSAHAAAILSSIEMAVEMSASGLASGLVTNPISKSVLYAAGFKHPGHTEFVAMLTQNLKQSGPRGPVMMLAGKQLRVALVSIHTSLKEAISGLNAETIIHTARVTAYTLQQDFGIKAPRLALAGLNPHAGEGGSLGREEITIIEPAANALRDEGIDIVGPLPPDAMFHEEARAKYDAAICLYHDQGLIPFKALDFWGGVNVTLGLPVIRTSPDHGTGFDIAGKGVARADSLIAAIRLAADMAARRAA
ncbi:4-hydroxythreonine-4-phosphate dehydrogenase PdxA [Hyphobacterium sp. CCMP332]|jgi:4-hydroxythreonine-4-phosphate dehydrogenase|uniref:4-hydroxythreonine-4-phosphate dehydrogenase PdxA n=1 Tax=Hyphobacterium sp. CCMP332 TaxID=2749086 RepID=UPI001650C447|nr:4-hydroxythreonine-4-phosphate dehydrogenase PdxA [Hyphobacterium sp. CCMP332]QNL18543.1 4-hydroxythreonine-4-phosphate dehydrogenase PdxA [Hyphobacterium sp. CCMP332]